MQDMNEYMSIFWVFIDFIIQFWINRYDELNRALDILLENMFSSDIIRTITAPK